MNHYREIFIPKYVVESFMDESINESRMIPLLTIANRSTKGQLILSSWIKHLKGWFNNKQTKYKVPYYITINPKSKLKTLWIEKRY